MTSFRRQLPRAFPTFFLIALPLALASPAASGGAGPDLAALRVGGIINHGPNGAFQGYSVGAMTCNVGDQPVFVCDADSADCDAEEHPIFVFNLYHLWTGRFDQIGMSWVQHITPVGNTLPHHSGEPYSTAPWLEDVTFASHFVSSLNDPWRHR